VEIEEAGAMMPLLEELRAQRQLLEALLTKPRAAARAPAPDPDREA
jgi:hypothetical protein